MVEKILEKNLKYLQKSYPHVLKALKKHKKNDCQANVETAKNGELNVKVSFNGNNVYLHSNYDQQREIDALLNNVNLENKDTLIILGFGMGYHIEKIIHAYPNLNKIIIEPRAEIFECILEHKDITNLLKAKNVELFVTDDPNQIVAELITLYRSGRISLVEFLTLPSYGRLYKTLLQETNDIYTKFLRTFKVNTLTTLLFKKLWLQNFLFNLKHIPESADLIDLAGSFHNVPAIMVSAGPSLSKNIELLREVQNKALILAAGSTISILQNADIKPHIMFGIDGGAVMTEIYSKVKWTDILLAYICNLHHGTLDFYVGPKIYTKTNVEPHVDWMEQSINHLSGHIASGGSCANVALDFLKKLGCNPVIMIGQDLAFTDMEFYADGHFNKENMTVKGMNPAKLIKTKDIHGNDIYTADYLMTMAHCFEGYLVRQPEDNLFINATEGGLPLKGTRVMTLRQAINEYCTEEKGIKNRLNSLVTQSKGDNENLKEGIKEFINTLKKQSDKIEEISRNRFKLVNGILRDIDNNKLNSVSAQSKKLLALTEELEGTDLFQKVLRAASYEILLVMKNNCETLVNQIADTREKMRILYRGLKSQFELIQDINSSIGANCDEALRRMR